MPSARKVTSTEGPGLVTSAHRDVVMDLTQLRALHYILSHYNTWSLQPSSPVVRSHDALTAPIEPEDLGHILTEPLEPSCHMDTHGLNSGRGKNSPHVLMNVKHGGVGIVLAYP